LKLDDRIQQQQIERLTQFKNARNRGKADQCLQMLSDKAGSGENLVPAVIEAIENRCTLGEIADELRSVFGEYK
jgi:methylmalonyl-CoA mutase N-terminal domain/subunit